MKVEILHIDDCPNWEEAGRMVREALAASGREDVAVTFTLLRSQEDASRVPFGGSPTITIDGADLFPAGVRIADLACRVYSTPDGLAGLPTAEQLANALERRGGLGRRCGLWVAVRPRADGL